MGYPREVIEQVKKAVCKEAMEMRQLNHVVPVTGKRLQIVRPAKGVRAGFRLAAKDGSGYFDCSDDEIMQMLMPYFRNLDF